MSIDRWVETAKGNHVALGNGGIIATVYQTRDGSWSAVWSGGPRGLPQQLKGKYCHPEEVQEVIEQTERGGMEPSEWNPPDAEWQQAKKGGFYRRLFGAVVSVKQAKSGSWYATKNGALIGRSCQPEWFAAEQEAMKAVDQLEHRVGGWAWIERH